MNTDDFFPKNNNPYYYLMFLGSVAIVSQFILVLYFEIKLSDNLEWIPMGIIFLGFFLFGLGWTSLHKDYETQKKLSRILFQTKIDIKKEELKKLKKENE